MSNTRKKTEKKSKVKVIAATVVVNPTGVKPVQDWTMIKLISKEKISDGGLILTVEQREKQQQGFVVDCGPGKYNNKGVLIPLEVKPGDRVWFGVFKGTVITVGPDEFLMMREKDITGVACQT